MRASSECDSAFAVCCSCFRRDAFSIASSVSLSMSETPCSVRNASYALRAGCKRVCATSRSFSSSLGRFVRARVRELMLLLEEHRDHGVGEEGRVLGARAVGVDRDQIAARVEPDVDLPGQDVDRDRQLQPLFDLAQRAGQLEAAGFGCELALLDVGLRLLRLPHQDRLGLVGVADEQQRDQQPEPEPDHAGDRHPAPVAAHRQEQPAGIDGEAGARATLARLHQKVIEIFAGPGRHEALSAESTGNFGTWFRTGVAHVSTAAQSVLCRDAAGQRPSAYRRTESLLDLWTIVGTTLEKRQ